MSLYYQTIALWICGVCPKCRHRAVVCERGVEESMFDRKHGHQYDCEECGASEFVVDFMVDFAYQASAHWESPPESKP